MGMMNKFQAVLLLLTGVASAKNNDKCPSALRLYENEPVSGDNSFAVSDFSDVDACGPNSHLEGVWYEIIGAGEDVTLNVCTENQRTLSVGVFSACNSQSCVGYPPNQLSPASCNRNEYLRYRFFAERDRSYHVHLRANVIDFSSVMLGAEFKIFYRTTGSPTSTPTIFTRPTLAPSATKLTPVGSTITNGPINVDPSSLPYQTSNFGKVSTCKSSTPTTYRVESETITYHYGLSESPSSAAGTALEIEDNLHRALSNKLLTCSFGGFWSVSYGVVEISIGHRDSVRSCPAGRQNDCSEVRGSMDMKVAYRSDGRRLNEEDLFRDLIPIFEDTLKSLGGEFRGFGDSESVGDDLVENDEVENNKGDDDYYAYIPNNNIEEYSRDGGPSSVLLGLGIAVGLIVLIILFICARRFMGGEFEKPDKPHEGVHQLPEDEESTVKRVDSPATEVDDGDVNGDGIAVFSTVKLEGSDHDFRSCGNPECEHCKPESRPVFISTRGTHDMIEVIEETKPSGLRIETLTYNDGWAAFGNK